jgi:hypothetical protein
LNCFEFLVSDDVLSGFLFGERLSAGLAATLPCLAYLVFPLSAEIGTEREVINDGSLADILCSIFSIPRH